VVFEAEDGMVDRLVKDLEGCGVFGQTEGVVEVREDRIVQVERVAVYVVERLLLFDVSLHG
jgi:hypothetical protein